jgi:hypothetical protein
MNEKALALEAHPGGKPKATEPLSVPELSAAFCEIASGLLYFFSGDLTQPSRVRHDRR